MIHPRQAAHLVRQNLARNPKHYLFASVGIVVGVAMLSFFVALGAGVRARVLNAYFPVNQVELEPEHVGVLGVQEAVPNTEITPERLERLGQAPGISGLYPKQRSRFQALFWGGRALFGFDARAEAFFDGLEPALVRDELQQREEHGHARKGKVPLASRHTLPCDGDLDCPAGYDCTAKTCVRHPFWTDFRAPPMRLPCASDAQCAPGETCHDALCRPGCDPGAPEPGTLCEDGARFERCGPERPCTDGLACIQRGAHSVCDFQRCVLRTARDQTSEDPAILAGTILRPCPPGAAPGSADCPSEPCPLGTYCATDNVRSRDGACERPLPVLLNPFLLDVFNATAASALKLPRLDDPRLLLGLSFFTRLGDSFFVQGEERSQQRTRRARVVGFTDKAPMLGITMPLKTVQRFNAHFRGRGAARTFDSILAVSQRNEDLSAVIQAAERLRFSVAPASREARKLANMLLILTMVFGAISLVIMAIAAVNIAHTFLMMVAERRHEIGIMRALGATPSDIRLLILLEAALVGLLGGILGHLLAYAMSRAANAVATRLLEGVVVLPGDLFSFQPAFVALSLLGAVLFAVFGALVAARKAARLDPATVLSSS